MLHPDHLSDLASPSLPGARCRDRVELYDAAAGGPDRVEVQHARVVALQICQSCPALQPCRQWFGSLPAPQRPRGVIAGRLVTKRSAHTPW